MKNLKFLTVLLCVLTFSCLGKEQSTTTKNQAKINTIEVYDFHTTNRCITCKAIESNTLFTLQTYFSEELNSGKITFNVINVDDKSNYELAKKFEASGTSLFLNVIYPEKEEQIDLTELAFTYGKKQEIFSEKLKKQIENKLKNL